MAVASNVRVFPRNEGMSKICTGTVPGQSGENLELPQTQPYQEDSYRVREGPFFDSVPLFCCFSPVLF